MSKSKKAYDKSRNSGEMFNNKAEEKSYKRYKQGQYLNLIFKALLALLLGMLVAGFLGKLNRMDAALIDIHSEVTEQGALGDIDNTELD